MSLFTKSTGEISEIVTEFIAPSNDFEPIPDGTKLICEVISAVWVECGKFNPRKQNIALELLIIDKNSEFVNRMQKQTLHFGAVNDKTFEDNLKKQDKAIDFFTAYIGISGKTIIQQADAKGIEVIGNNNILLKALVGTKVLALIRLMSEKMKDKEGNEILDSKGKVRWRHTNYIDGLQPVPKAAAKLQSKAIEEEDASILAKAAEMPDPDFDDDFEDEIPF